MRPEDKSIFLNLSDDKCMTIAMTGEARGEKDDPAIPNDEGRILVGSIALNRADYGQIHHGWGKLWGDSVKTVIAAKNQFSCFNSNDPNYGLLAELINDFDASLVKYSWLSKIYEDAQGLIAGTIPRNCKGIYYETLASHELFDQFREKLGRNPKIEIVIGHHRVYDEY